ncbi:SLC13/DASS family transporter [Schaalia sp. ZJ405]|uniref:SLC13 family permease n=1 Tax=unclassified Schaalia TaxID=2691889 RepID=UPI0013EC6F9F|nr:MULTISPECIES: DASS family sodium-coupled anion symporter [unclassified Schaalia]QPK82117.1 SLC13/DASS family transporter [Schaalia sp. ZJ405]
MATRSRASLTLNPRGTTKRKPVTKESGISPAKIIGQVGAAIAVVTFLFVELPGLDPAGSRMFGIFLAAILLWVTEAIPLFATAALVMLLEVLFVSDKAILAVAEDAPAYTTFFGALANPVIILFLGGFMLADGAAKYKVDRALSAVLLKPFLGNPRLTVMGIMLITALMSMFMSNTATTATMFAVMMPVILGLPEGKARTGIALSIPVAANVGGMGTPVGTPPNAIALGALDTIGMSISFLDWMLAAVPLMLVVLAVSWVFISWRYIPGDVPFVVDTSAKFDTSRNATIFYVTAVITVILWMTEAIHGLSSNVVGFIPVVVLLVLKVMTGDDLKTLDWPVLWLVAGGIALGSGVGSTGLDTWLLGSIEWEAIPAVLLLLVLALVGWVTSNVISHSASANLLIPMGIGLATTVDSSTAEIAIVLALGCSLGMCLPISTPPNAIAYSTGTTPTKEMTIVGLVVGVVGVILLALVAPLTWGALGII